MREYIVQYCELRYSCPMSFPIKMIRSGDTLFMYLLRRIIISSFVCSELDEEL